MINLQKFKIKNINSNSGLTLVEILLALVVGSILIVLTLNEMTRLQTLQRMIEIFVDRQEIKYTLDNNTDCEITIAQCTNPATDIGKRVNIFRKSGNILIGTPNSNLLTWRLQAECDFTTPNFRSIRVSGVPNVSTKDMPQNITFSRAIRQVTYNFCQSGNASLDPDESTITQISPYSISGVNLAAQPITPINVHDCYEFGNPTYPNPNPKVHDENGNEILPTPPDTRLAHRSGFGIATCPPDTLLVGGGGLFVYWNQSGYYNGGGPSGFFPYRDPNSGVFSYRARVCAAVNSDYTVNLIASNVTAICNPRSNGGRFK